MLLLSAKPLVDLLKQSLAEQVLTFVKTQGRAPRLAVVIVGHDPASLIYVRKKGEMAETLGFTHKTITLPFDSSPAFIRRTVDQLNQDAGVDGILIQRPLPSNCKAEEIVGWVDPQKDVDGFHPENVGRLSLGLNTFQPCTPSGIIKLLKFYKIPLQGKTACIVGRSPIVGKPMAALLLQEDSTVIHCHSQTPHLEQWTRVADLVVSAVGKTHIIGTGHIKPGATVIDVGMNRDSEGKLVGDVDFQTVSKIAGAITPVPGGVGPMTILGLMQNTITAAQVRSGMLRFSPPFLSASALL